jgi:carboxyl-terminal processing protease
MPLRVPVLLLLAQLLLVTPAVPPPPEATFLEAWTIARDNFYEAARVGADWEHTRDELLPAARDSTSPAETSRVINAALDRLHASHTHHYHAAQREYYELLDIFHADGVPADLSPHIPAGPVSYVGIGVIAREIDARTFAADVYPSGPADRAGLLVGDELLGVEDGPWSEIDAFRQREGVPTRLVVRRSADESPRTLSVVPERIHPRQLFLAAMDASARVIEHNAERCAYVRVRSYAHPDYQDKLVELARTRFNDCDALLLDLRGPWGGANPEYLDLFNPLIPTLASKPRDAAWEERPFTWKKPAALLIDSDVRSGKEIIARAFRTHHLGPLVGERTGGAVLAGRPFILSDGSVLYLAVADVRIDGERLEGTGVEPTVPAARPIPYTAGRDPVIDAGVDAVLGTLRHHPATP